MKDNQSHSGLEIAVIGMACRFPGASNWRQYWDNLVNGREAIEFLSDQELVSMGVDLKKLGDPNFVKARSIVKEKALFDAAFFDYRPNEAQFMNPMHRIFHECVWEALEDAGHDPGQVKGGIGLFAGAGGDFNWRINSTLQSASAELDDFTFECINNKDYLASLISYKLNLKGPAVAVNTACSTSLVAISLACRSLLLGESSMALAGGVSIVTEKQPGYSFQEGMINSRDGHCKAFDKEASGTVTGEGAGVVVLKRLSDALRDRDQIHCVIKGTAINNDGNRKVGFTAPSVEGQVECIRKAQRFARVEPDTISYVEAHGTGTRLGDPIEVQALNVAFNHNTAQPCALGSVKTNIGHLDTAAGVAGLIKTVLCLKHKKLLPSLHFSEPNPEIDFDGGPFYVNTETKDWTTVDAMPRRAGVSSFGIGGTNAHAILEEAPELEKGDVGRPYKLLTLSARTENSLRQYGDKLRRFLDKEDANLADLSYTLQAGRKHFAYRNAITYRHKTELFERLDELASGKRIAKVGDRRKNVVFMFPGQGSQYSNMAVDLYLSEPGFRSEMDKAFTIIADLTGECFRDVLFSDEANPKIDNTRYTQPILFLVEYALARYMMSIGVVPQYMIGHSIGEYVAACVSGVFDIEDALRIVVKRGELMSQVAPGAMVSVPISEEEAASFMTTGLSIAAINAPRQVVLSGDLSAVELLKTKLDESGISYLKLNTSHAFHSAMLDPVLAEFQKELEKVTFRQMTIPFLSNVTGKLITAQEAMSVDYWSRHMRQAVRFSEGISHILSKANDVVLVEVGAGHVLTNLVKQHAGHKNAPPSINLIRASKEKENDLKFLTRQIGQLWMHGVSIDWSQYGHGEKRRKISLPTYAFDPVSFPAEVNPVESARLSGLHLLASTGNKELKDWMYFPSWKRCLLNAGTRPGGRTYLFFSHDRAFSDAVDKILTQAGNAVIEVYAGDAYEKEGTKAFRIDPQVPAHFCRLLSELKQQDIIVTDVIYGWAIGSDSHHARVGIQEEALSVYYFSVISLIQAFSKQASLQELSFVFLVDSLGQVIGTENNAGNQALLVGLANVLPQEYAVSSRVVDFHSLEPNGVWVNQLISELTHVAERRDRIVAYRHGLRWVQDYQKNSQAVHHTAPVKPQGLYMITGGLGNLGFTLAKHLVTKYDARVVLTGRKKVIAAIDDGLEADRLRELMTFTDHVHYFTADIAQPEKLNALTEHIENIYGKIDGVIHAAGVLGNTYFELIEDATADSALAMFAPKVTGIQNLYTVFKDRDPDFVWVASSIAAVLGGLSFSAYAAANAFMDYFIGARRSELPQWKCVDFAGLGFDREQLSGDSSLLNPEELVDFFEWSLSVEGGPVVIQSKSELSLWIDKVYNRQKAKTENAGTKNKEGARQDRPNLSTHFTPASTATEIKLKQIFEDFFGVVEIGINDGFFEIGGDSLKAMILLKRVKREFSVNLPLRDFLDGDNIFGIAAKIDEVLWFKTEVKMTHEITI